MGSFRHSPCGSVDWNFGSISGLFEVSGHSPCGSVDWNVCNAIYRLLHHSHSPCGSVDWNITCSACSGRSRVTPLVGVWIEIRLMVWYKTFVSVTPLVGVWIEILFPSRMHSSSGVTPLVGVWIEICTYLLISITPFCHSPCGSVDWNYNGIC